MIMITIKYYLINITKMFNLIKINMLFIKWIFDNLPHSSPSSEPSKQSFLPLHNISTETHVVLLSQDLLGNGQLFKDDLWIIRWWQFSCVQFSIEAEKNIKININIEHKIYSIDL